jgi:hypothetical protein
MKGIPKMWQCWWKCMHNSRIFVFQNRWYIVLDYFLGQPECDDCSQPRAHPIETPVSRSEGTFGTFFSIWCCKIRQSARTNGVSQIYTLSKYFSLLKLKFLCFIFIYDQNSVRYSFSYFTNIAVPRNINKLFF